MYRAGNCHDRSNNTFSKVIPLYSSEHLCCFTGPITIEDINNNINESTKRVNKIMRRFAHHCIQKCTGKTRGTNVHSRWSVRKSSYQQVWYLQSVTHQNTSYGEGCSNASAGSELETLTWYCRCRYWSCQVNIRMRISLVIMSVPSFDNTCSELMDLCTCIDIRLSNYGLHLLHPHGRLNWYTSIHSRPFKIPFT